MQNVRSMNKKSSPILDAKIKCYQQFFAVVFNKKNQKCSYTVKMVIFSQQFRDTCEQAFILSVDVRPECEEQNKRLVEWLGGESKALELLAVRMKHEEKVF